MKYIDSIMLNFKRLFDFNGRANRAEFWVFMAFTVFLVLLLGYVFGTRAGLISVLAVFVPCLSLTVRRLHDLDKSEGWAYLGAFTLMMGSLSVLSVPFLIFGGVESYIYAFYGGVALILAVFAAMVYFLGRKGTDGENRYGAAVD